MSEHLYSSDGKKKKKFIYIYTHTHNKLEDEYYEKKKL